MAPALSFSRIQDISSRARQISASELRRLLPPSQRIEILSFGLASNFQASDAEHGRFEDTLAKFALPGVWPDPSDTLSGQKVLTFDRFLPCTRTQYAYVGMEILDTPPRNLLDLWMALQRAYAENTPLIDVVYEQVLSSLSEQTFVSENERREFEEFLVRIGQHASGALATHSLTLDPGFTKGATLHRGKWSDFDYQWDTARDNGTVLVVWGPQWHLSLTGKEKTRLSPRSRAWLILLHDLLISQGRLADHSLLTEFIVGSREKKKEPLNGLIFTYDSRYKSWEPLSLPRELIRVVEIDRIAYELGRMFSAGVQPTTRDSLIEEWDRITSLLMSVEIEDIAQPVRPLELD